MRAVPNSLPYALRVEIMVIVTSLEPKKIKTTRKSLRRSKNTGFVLVHVKIVRAI
jgi:hypothetical protein